MKKLIIIVSVSAVLVVFLIILAFLYIDLSGHRGFHYDLLVSGKPCGTLKIDRYVTEDKIIYKSSASYPYSPGYPAITEKLSLRKRGLTPLRFIEEADGVKGQKRLTLLVQNGGRTDFLFLEHPRFLTLKGFETGKTTMIFSPDDIMLYMPIMEKYNFWKKGTQFFEVMVPVGEPIPPMRDKLEVRYLGDEYIPFMGRRVETESFLVDARGLPKARVFLSRYTHRILALEIENMNMQFILVSFMESPGKRVKPLLDKFFSLFRSGRGQNKLTVSKTPLSGKSGSALEAGTPADVAKFEEKGMQSGKRVQRKEIFFESGNLILSGRMWIPEGKAPFSAALIVPKDGPVTRGEQYLLESLADFLSAAGTVVLVFDSPGQGKSQGNFMELDDERRIQDIISAVSYLEGHPAVREGCINLIGHEGGGYLALKAAQMLPSVRSCVLLGIPGRELVKTDSFQIISKDNIQALLDVRGLGPFDERFMETITEKAQTHLKIVAKSSENFSFFMGVRLPLKEYKEFIARRPYRTMLSSDRPFLLVFGRDDRLFDSRTVEALKKELDKEDRHSRMAVFRSLGAYMGKMVECDSSWTFSMNDDVLGLVRNWIKEMNASI